MDDTGRNPADMRRAVKRRGRLTRASALVGWISAMCLAATAASADIYRYVDESGVMHFTNAPTSSRYKIYIRSRPNPSRFFGGGGGGDPGRFDHLIAIAAKQYSIPFNLVKSIIKVESGFNSQAVSHKGAQGLMQLMPDTAKLMDVWDPFDPGQNIMGGTKYFRMLLDRFSGKVKLALAGYNAGPLRVEEHKGIPPIKETQDYVERVIAYYLHLKQKQDGKKGSVVKPAEAKSDSSQPPPSKTG